MPASSNPDQNSDACGDSKSDEGAVFDFRGNPVQGIGDNPAADLDCLIAVSYTHLDVYKRQG